MKNLVLQSVAPTLRRRGVSLVEVLFAMMIALVGLAGVLSIFPMAARQAADSYSLNQATNGAMNAAAVSAAARDVVPSEQSPWVLPDDRMDLSGNSTDYFDPPLNNYNGNPAYRYKPVKAFSKIYEGLREKAIADGFTPAAAIRRTIGQGFCYDPLYVANVPITTNYTAGIDRPSRMPFFSEFVNPLAFGGGQFAPSVIVAGYTNTPRLMRVSSLANLNVFPLTPLSAIAANARVANIGDLIPAAIQKDKSFGALREFDGVDSGSLISAGSNSDLSWFATVVPVESKSVEYPTQFNVSIVLIKKRDRTFDVPVVGATTLPPSERLAIVTSTGFDPGATPPAYPAPPNPLPYSSGSTLNVTLHFDSRTSSTLRVNDYVMLSRNMLWNIDDYPTYGPKVVQRHAWYRVAAVGELEDTNLANSQLSRDVVLQGRPWDYADLNPSLNYPSALVTTPYSLVRTVATVVENVVAVYEYPLNITE